MKKMKSILAVLFAVALFVCMNVSALAADSAVTYDGNAKKFVFSTGSTGAPNDLFNNFKGVMPGDTLTQQITVKNDVSNGVKVKLYLRSTGAEKGSEEFLSKMHLNVIQDGTSELFAASANQAANLNDWVCLGTFYSGAEVNLTVKLDVPKELDNRFQNAVGALGWRFKVEELPIGVNDPRAPKTGDETNFYLYIGICVASIGILMSLTRIKRNNK